jgi:hypothetical protein
MKTAAEMKPNSVALIDGHPWLVQKAEFTKSGRNSAIVKMKLKNLINGSKTETVYKATTLAMASSVDAVDAGDGRQLHAVLEAELVDLLDLLPLGVAADGEDLEAAFQRQHDGLGQAGVDHVGRQADALQALDLGGQLDLARLDDQHVGALGHFFGRQVQRARHVGDHAAGLDLGDVQDLLAGARGAGDDHVHVAQQLVVVGRAGDLGVGRVLQDRLLELSSFFRSRPAITTSSKAMASSRALTEPIEPVAPMTMVLALTFAGDGPSFTRPMRAWHRPRPTARRWPNSCCRW